jgi:hypothetical protein
MGPAIFFASLFGERRRHRIADKKSGKKGFSTVFQKLVAKAQILGSGRALMSSE